MCNLNETNDMTRLHRGRISKSQSNIQLLRELSTKKRSQSFFSASTFPWEQKLWNHKILGKCWNQHPEDKNMHNSVQLPHPSEESVYMVSSCFQRSRERVLWTWNKKFHTACKFLACVLPSCTQWRQADDRWWPNGLLAGCILIQLTHVTSTLFRDIQIHSVKQTSHPPKRGLPKQRSSLPLPSVFRCYVVRFREVANHHPRRSPSLSWKLRKLHSTLGWNLECCLPWVSWLWFHQTLNQFTPWLLKSEVMLFDWSLIYRNAAHFANCPVWQTSRRCMRGL